MALVQPQHRPPPAVATARALPLRLHRWTALGTQCELQFVCGDDTAAARFITAAVTWVENFEARYSRYRPTSLVSQINAAAGQAWVPIDAEMAQMLDFCASLHFLTRGVLDATAGPLLRLWDYKAPTPRLPTPSELAATLRLVGWPKVERAPGQVRLPLAGMSLDFGGWGKEYAVDAIAALAQAHGLERVLVDFGHDLRALGSAPGKPGWHIGLEDPANPTGPCRGSLAITDRGVASSGDYLRGFTLGGRRYGHIIDPRTGQPVANGCQQVTVIAPTCLKAGALATAAFILGPTEGLRLVTDLPGAEARILTTSAVHQTRNFYTYVVTP